MWCSLPRRTHGAGTNVTTAAPSSTTACVTACVTVCVIVCVTASIARAPNPHRCGPADTPDTADGPGGRILDLDGWVGHVLDHDTHGERHDGFELLLIGPFQDGAEGECRCLPPAPIGVANVLVDERHDDVDHVVLDCLSYARETRGRRHRHVPRVVVVQILVLLAQRLEQQRHHVRRGALDEIVASARRVLPTDRCANEPGVSGERSPLPRSRSKQPESSAASS